MRKFIFSRLLSSCMVLGLLLSHIPLAALASQDKDISRENALSYIYLGKELSNLSQIVDQATLLDENEESLLHVMKKYMDGGSLIAGYEEVIETLEYAEHVIENTINRSSRDTTKNQLHIEIAELIEQIMDGALCIDLDSLERGHAPKGCCPAASTNFKDKDCNGIVNCCRVFLINKELQVCGNALFKGDVKIEDDLRVGGELKVKEGAVFKEDVTIKGSLTAHDAYISILDTTTLSADNAFIDSLSVNDLVVSDCMENLCVNNLSVNDLTVASCMDSLCVQNFSAVDAVINNLSVTDLAVASCMDSLCVQNFSAVDAVIDNLIITSTILDSVIGNLTVTGTLSANDAIIQNATITDLVVLSCMDSLCVNDLSVVDISISGTLSVNDIIIDDATISSLSVTDAIIQNATITDLVVLSCMDSLCVNNLSVVDMSVSGTLSVNDVILDDATISSLSVTDLVVLSCMDSLCVNNLSVTDLVVLSCMDSLCVNNLSVTDLAVLSCMDSLCVNNLSVTDLVVLSCMDSLCVNNLSVVDMSISGTLSVNDVILDDVTVNSFSATDAVISNSLTVSSLTPAGVVHNSALGLLSSSLIVNADVDAAAAIVDTKLATISTAGKVANSATTATSADTPNTIVLRDGSGNFATNMITLDGTVTNPTDATTKAYVDSLVGAGGTNLNTPNTLVQRDGTGSFAAQVVSVVDSVATGNLVFTGATSTSTTGNITKGGSRFIHNFGTNNTFMGVNAGNFTMTGASNTVMGTTALSGNTSGGLNTAIGAGALASNTGGGNNTAVGANALNANTTPSQNTAIGSGALVNCTLGNSNVAIGAGALSSLTTGGLNIAIGQSAGGVITTGIGNIYIDASAAVTNEGATTRIGNSQTRCFINGIRGATTGVVDAVAVLIDSAGQLGTISSSEKVKHDIEDMGSSSDAVMQLRPVTFVYNGDESETTQYGLIAEEVDQVFPAIVVRDKNGQPETVQYHVLPVLLLNEMKKQQAVNARQDEAITHLNITVEAMQIAINELQSKLTKHIN